ncbi:MAG TPA: cytochrome c [Candidatus Saccharimonadales bacterium]|jgi:mono/diheme cytochrome c family protein|nr:cytochrome c [Candidatus Saccharimonadales bacterium]
MKSRRCRINTPAQPRLRLQLFAAIFVGGVCSLALSGCRQDMHNQPKFIPLRQNDFYADQRASRDPVPGAIARGQLKEDTYFYTGKRGVILGNDLPAGITFSKDLLRRGQERYRIYCTPCHSELGEGRGMIVQRGYQQPPSFHDERLRNAPLGHFFDVASNGFGAMPDYSAQIKPADRWAIAAYIRALQLSQHPAEDDLKAAAPANDRVATESKEKPKTMSLSQPAREGGQP